MKKEINLIKELRLVLCGWCFAIALCLAPKNDAEGLIIIKAVRHWASKSAAYITSRCSGSPKAVQMSDCGHVIKVPDCKGCRGVDSPPTEL